MNDGSQHRSLSLERWSALPFEQQILAAGNEMNRALAMARVGHWDRAPSSYERVLRLIDLSVAAASTRGRRRELLRWRDLAAALYLDPAVPLAAHEQAFRALLQFTPSSALQINPLLGRFAG